MQVEQCLAAAKGQPLKVRAVGQQRGEGSGVQLLAATAEVQPPQPGATSLQQPVGNSLDGGTLKIGMSICTSYSMLFS